MPDLQPATNSDMIVRVLKGDKGTQRLLPGQPQQGDYSIGAQWHQYAPGDPQDVDMDKTGTVQPSFGRYPEPMVWPLIPEHDWMHDKIGQGMFGVPPQRLQQMAGDVVPFPRQPGQVLEPEQYQRALEKMKGVDTRKLLDDVLGAPGSVVPFPSPPTPTG